MQYPTFTLIAALTILGNVHCAAVEVETEETGISSYFNTLNKRTNYPDATYAQMKELSTKPSAANVQWCIGYWTEPDCKGKLVAGHMDGTTGKGKKSDRPCFAVTDNDQNKHPWMSEDDKKKIESGAVYLKADGATHKSQWQAKLVVKGDKLSPCGTSNAIGLSGDGWIGGGDKVPDDGWTCKNGKFSAHIVKTPKAQL
ncbi:MAG: hypothetical protein M1812_001253 [Candelaria pacifica]|nr:MAG: hypothetical protein M1812_001253 [Candelaria pacifica]